MDDKKLKGLIDEVKAVGDAGKDMASSDELKELESAIKAETTQLKDIAKSNQIQNAAQIVYEVIKTKKEQGRDRDLAADRALDRKKSDDDRKQRKLDTATSLKRDQGGKAAREIILEQNKMTLESLNRIEKTLGLISKQDGRGGTAGAPSGKPNPKPTGPKSQAEKDIDQAAKNAKEISEKDKAIASKTTIGQGEGKAGTGEKLDTAKKRKGYGMDDEDYARQYERDQAALKRESTVKDVGALSADVKTTGKSLNKR